MFSRRLRITLVCCVVAIMIVQPISVAAKFLPNDTHWPQQDELVQSKVDAAWDPTNEEKLTNPGSNNIVIAILSEGVDWIHDDIGEEAMWLNEDEEYGDNGLDPWDPEADGMPGLPGVDDDGDGWADYYDFDVRWRDYDKDWDLPGGHGPLHGWDGIVGTADDDPEDMALAASDDDENGYPDDFHGYDFNDNDGNPKGEDDTDHYSTRIAGVVAATIHNAIGIAGVAQVEIMAVRVLETNGNPIASGFVEEGWTYAVDNGADIIFNCAVWDDDSKSMTFLDNEIAYAAQHRTSIIVPSGPEDDDPCWYPGSNWQGSYIITVGSSYSDGAMGVEHRYPLSAYGDHLDFLAPGYQVKVPYYDDTLAVSLYASTSMVYFAAAQVAGVVAQMLTARQSLEENYLADPKMMGKRVQRIQNILKASCIDITDAAGPKKDQDASVGYDDETGFGELDAAKALTYASAIRNQWSDNLMHDQFDVQFSEYKQPAIAVDKDGYSHVIYIEDQNGGETFYAQFTPAGRMNIGPMTVELGTTNIPSHSPDIFVDWDKNVHICWAEHIAQQADHIYYRKMNHVGGFVGNPVAVKPTATLKEYLNIVVIDPFEWNPYIVYSEQPVIFGVYNIEEVHFDWVTQQWQSNQVLGDNDNSYKKPSVDMGEVYGVCEIYMAYEFHESGQKIDIKYKATNDLLWEFSKDISDDFTKDDIHPNLAVLQTSTNDCDVYIVWEKEDTYFVHMDDVYIVAINGPTNNAITFNRPWGNGIKVNHAEPLEPHAPQLVGEIEFPKVSASKISYSLGRSDVVEVFQIDVIWRCYDNDLQWELRLMELSHDLRRLRHLEGNIIKDSHGFPQIASSQLRFPDAHSDDWHNFDGNFRLLSFFTEGLRNMLQYQSTSSRWNQISTIENTGSYLDPDIAIDRDNGLHVVYQDDMNRIWYAMWPFGSRPPMEPGAGPIQISNGLRTSKRPKVTTIVEDNTVFAVMICYDHTNDDLWYYKVDSSGIVDKSGRLACCPADGEEEFAHEIVNDVENGNIGIVWYESNYGYAYDLYFGVITYDNGNVQSETNGVVERSMTSWVDDKNPDIDVDTSGQYHIVYQREESPDEYGIYYNIAYKFEGSYTKKYTTDLTVDSSDKNMNPAIRVDRDIYRRSDRDHDVTGGNTRTNRYVHISYCSQDYSSTDYEVHYVKVADTKEILVSEKDAIITMTDNAFTTTIEIEMSLNEDNQVGLVICGIYDDFIGSTKRGIYYTKLDNNGELLTSMMLVSDKSVTPEDIQPSAEYDLENNMNIVWMYKNGAPDVVFTWEKGIKEPWAI